jgi:DNA-binding Lrp family transcriptional regulator
VLGGSRLFPGVHKRARFNVIESATAVDVAVTSTNGAIAVDAKVESLLGGFVAPSGCRAVAPRYAARMITSFVFIKSEPRATVSLSQKIADLDGVREVYSTMGESDIIAILWVADHEKIATVVTEQIAALPGVLSTRTSIAYRAYSSSDKDLV